MIPVYQNSLGDEAVLCFADRAPLCSAPLHLKKKEGTGIRCAVLALYWFLPQRSSVSATPLNAGSAV